MPRYEITGRATDVYSVETVQDALRRAGAARVKARNAFGWSNQPQVATFYADDSDKAARIADVAAGLLSEDSLPSLIPYAY